MRKVYLLHFERNNFRAQHYIGNTNNLPRRISQHRNGQGAALTRAVSEKGIGLKVVRTWKGGYELEKKLKARKEAHHFCPECNPKMKRFKTRKNF